MRRNGPVPARLATFFLNDVASLSTCHPEFVSPFLNELDLKAPSLMRYKLSVAIVSCQSLLSQLWACGDATGAMIKC